MSAILTGLIKYTKKRISTASKPSLNDQILKENLNDPVNFEKIMRHYQYVRERQPYSGDYEAADRYGTS